LGKITYQADNSEVKPATNLHFKNWGISNTGDFMDDGDENDTYIMSTNITLPGNSSDLYMTARKSALSLVYYAFCLENGEYNLKLHFMEIQFSDQELYSRLGRRIFDVYVQVYRYCLLNSCFCNLSCSMSFFFLIGKIVLERF